MLPPPPSFLIANSGTSWSVLIRLPNRDISRGFASGMPCASNSSISIPFAMDSAARSGQMRGVIGGDVIEGVMDGDVAGVMAGDVAEEEEEEDWPIICMTVAFFNISSYPGVLSSTPPLPKPLNPSSPKSMVAGGRGACAEEEGETAEGENVGEEVVGEVGGSERFWRMTLYR